MRLVGREKLAELGLSPSRIRNICILAHVDHGKTTLADSLVASNGIISGKLAGKLRYLDSRPDEQQRGITMKSSCIALCHPYQEGEDYLINLIDSPGHVDFASEVSTAVRLCDGAIVVVDVVEGVCPQTRSVLSVSYREGLKPVLVLNKMDRLVTEMKLSPLDAYVHLTQVLEQVNAVVGEIFATDVMEQEERVELKKTVCPEGEDRGDDWQSALEQADDSNLYFSPEAGNVLFASAVDGWAFGVKEFAKIISEKLGFSEKVLLKTLWGDYYMNMKAKRIMRGAQEKAKKPLFVSFILENVWSLYETIAIRRDREKMMNIVEKLNIKLTQRDLRVTDSRAQLRNICSQWLPLAKACLDVVVEKIPSPNNLAGEKIERLMCGNVQYSDLPNESKSLKTAFLNCDPDAVTIAFVSKMFNVERRLLPENRRKILSQEELEARREIARQRHAEQEAARRQGEDDPPEETTTVMEKSGESSENPPEETKDEAEDLEHALIAFTRVYSGTITLGQELLVLGPKHDPRKFLQAEKGGEAPEIANSLKDLNPGSHVTRVKITRLYIMMGRELESSESVPAGNVCGIGGLEDHVLKTATLSTCVACPSFTELTSLSVPIFRVALEPKRSNDFPKLIAGLKLLNQADACALMHIQETGEIVLNTAGEVHLERCLEDLALRYAKVEINVSEPIVSFRETIVPAPKIDMVKEAIESTNDDACPEAWTSNRQCCFVLDAKPLPETVVKLLESNGQLIKQLESADFSSVDPKIGKFRAELIEAFADSRWNDPSQVVEKIWSFGPRKGPSNVLLNDTDFPRSSMWAGQSSSSKSSDPRANYEAAIVNGFQMACLAGPLCEEPMTGVCFILKKWEITSSDSNTDSHLGGQLMSACKDACRKIFSQRRPRLVTPMYTCSVLANSDVLGKLYAVFGRRQGRVTAAESALGFGGQFRVMATLPVPESFQLARELRTQTSGLASPQLVFSHWEVIEQDPYWVPSTEEEYLHFGEKADSGNRAKKYIDAVRRRKGLPVDSQLVTHAEKQRTLSKKK